MSDKLQFVADSGDFAMSDKLQLVAGSADFAMSDKLQFVADSGDFDKLKFVGQVCLRINGTQR